MEACFPNIDTVVNNPKRAVLAPDTRYRVLHMGMGRVYGVKYYQTDSTGKQKMKKNQSQVQGKETTLGERPIRIYIYEALNRLIHATGKAKNAVTTWQ